VIRSGYSISIWLLWFILVTALAAGYFNGLPCMYSLPLGQCHGGIAYFLKFGDRIFSLCPIFKKKRIQFKDPHSISTSVCAGNPCLWRSVRALLNSMPSQSRGSLRIISYCFPRKYTYNSVPNCHSALMDHKRQPSAKQERVLSVSVGSAPYLLIGTTELEGSLLILSAVWWLRLWCIYSLCADETITDLGWNGWHLFQW
jgi:hypothetical protein